MKVNGAVICIFIYFHAEIAKNCLRADNLDSAADILKMMSKERLQDQRISEKQQHLYNSNQSSKRFSDGRTFIASTHYMENLKEIDVQTFSSRRRLLLGLPFGRHYSAPFGQGSCDSDAALCC